MEWHAGGLTWPAWVREREGCRLGDDCTIDVKKESSVRFPSVLKAYHLSVISLIIYCRKRPEFLLRK